MKKNDFLSAPKTVKKLIKNYNFLILAKQLFKKFLMKEGLREKAYHQSKNEELQIIIRLTFCKKKIKKRLE